MATLVFSAVGTMVGGPIGGAVGSLVGSQVDAALFGSPNRQGARLKELDVTTSSYGQPIARHFGRMRVAGQMIWAADLVEHSEVLGGGKGAASVTNYSYTASFAVALSSRPILDLGRIWADGKLLRGEAGDLKTTGTLRIHTGAGDQDPDPLLLTAEGSRCPAHRDLAYVVFEDLDLSDFYNHIPSLTFEVIADEGFDLAAILGEVIDDTDAAVPLDGFLGFSNEGPLVDALSALDPVYPLDVDCAGTTIVIGRDRLQSSPIALGEATTAVEDGEFGAATGFSRSRAPVTEQPLAALRYYEPARDYLPGIQYATGRPSPGEPRVIELPAALEAADARALVERTSRRLDWSRDTLSWRTGELDAAVAPGSLVTLPGIAGTWRVREWEWRDTGVEIAAERVAPSGTAMVPALATDPGRSHPQADLPLAETLLTAFELPYDPASGTAGIARPFAALSSAQANWTGAALYADRGDGQLQSMGPSGRTRSAIGTTLTALGAQSPLIFDRTSRLVVRMADPAMQLASVNARQLAEGANLALVGGELIQFAQATSLGDGSWQLEGFARGCGGTEDGIAGHALGEGFLLVDGRAVALDPALLGTAAARSVVAIGRGDADGVRAPIALSGLTLRPLAPVHPRRTVLADGSWRLEWTRRARGIQLWQDGVDVPLVEEAESYLVTFGPVDAPLAMWTTSAPSTDLAPDMRAGLAAQSPGQWLRVAQVGTYARSASLDLCVLN
ncbi:putative tail protein [Novosphingobium sp. PhB165]|uniref:phage tail protein n=1 Tax=Novosphingobium sp. PhB165 TaxID=2485105 RepID=UPI00104B428E|nr:phage tail protein [Novosphingobium sp. PhB165]TCM16952.1 putative tail protein [Novosphingobium sp. PhB165]